MEKEPSSEIMRSEKIVVLIPTFNNATTLSNVLNSVLEFTDQIIVVNDGSYDDTAFILSGFSQLHVVSYPDNMGKGFALRTGFEKALELGYESVISVDSDGQHYASDLPRFIEKRITHRDAIIIGARNMDHENVPAKSSFGKRFSNFWFWVVTGVKLQDTQSGYRYYPAHRLKDIHFVTRKFEFEIEVLVRSSWAGIEVTEVPINVFYPEKGKRVSHFRPFRDFARISLLNTVLVLMAFFYIKPRNFLRGIKKKTIGNTFANNYLIQTIPIS